MPQHHTDTPRAEQAEVEYRDVPGFPGYRVGDDGSVWSCWNHGGSITNHWRQMKPCPFTGGYLGVTLRRERKNYPRKVHSLVLLAFVGPCPASMEACHFPDRDKGNNRLTNLRWDTRRGNLADRIVHETDPKGERNPAAKLVEADVVRIRAKVRGGTPMLRVAREESIHFSTIWRVMNTHWRHVK